ncbi:MAG: multidrug efflux SMR transporter [Bacteroidetes bacterium]|nr:multidrug efflux SMR transporter [Bacteroidota bacterium]
MSWILLIIAGLFETGFALCLGKAKEAPASAYWFWMGGFFACLLISMILLYYASKSVPIGTAYAVWTGIGAAGTVILGFFLFNEPATFWRIFFLSTLIFSVIGLKLVSGE